MPNRRNQRGFGAIETLLVIIIILLVVFIGYYIWHAQKQTNDTYRSANSVAQSSPAKGSTKSNAKTKKPASAPSGSSSSSSSSSSTKQ